MRKKLIIILIFFFVVFLFPKKIRGNNNKVAGSSAKISVLKDNNRNISNFTKKLVIKRILYKYNSPLIEAADSFIDVCTKYNLDCYLLPSISGIESTFGHFIYPNSYNPFGWGGGYITFKDWSEGIEIVGKGLKENYLDKGAVDLYQIGKIYAPPSTTWAYKVDFFRKEFYNEESKINELARIF